VTVLLRWSILGIRLCIVICGVLLLAACGGSPTATLSASSISFGDQVVGTANAGQAITLSNTGSAALRIVGIAVALPFAQTNTCDSSLAAGATCTINVTFDPTTDGDFTSNISITDNAEGSPQTAALSGTGIGQPLCTPIGGHPQTLERGVLPWTFLPERIREQTGVDGAGTKGYSEGLADNDKLASQLTARRPRMFGRLFFGPRRVIASNC
jgi:hypothetical protein